MSNSRRHRNVNIGQSSRSRSNIRRMNDDGKDDNIKRIEEELEGLTTSNE